MDLEVLQEVASNSQLFGSGHSHGSRKQSKVEEGAATREGQGNDQNSLGREMNPAKTEGCILLLKVLYL